jgi:hypothetical protein
MNRQFKPIRISVSTVPPEGNLRSLGRQAGPTGQVDARKTARRKVFIGGGLADRLSFIPTPARLHHLYHLYHRLAD